MNASVTSTDACAQQTYGLGETDRKTTDFEARTLELDRATDHCSMTPRRRRCTGRTPVLCRVDLSRKRTPSTLAGKMARSVCQVRRLFAFGGYGRCPLHRPIVAEHKTRTDFCRQSQIDNPALTRAGAWHPRPPSRLGETRLRELPDDTPEVWPSMAY